jgi:butyryl-CoA dehydrogenase
MCLTEPQAGSSLADIRTRADRVDGRTYRITGDKMWISGADHELSENIVHLVLAKIPGGPPGVKGISLFAVPKYLVGADGTRGARNGVRVSGVNHKMGQRGIVNCAIVFGQDGECLGELVGEPHKGLACMFHMMNEARVGVGLGAASVAYAGYAYSLGYAKERRQGRSPLQKDPSSPPIRIIEHADVKRMLLAQKVYAEGGLALCLYCARLLDVERMGESEAERREAAHLLEVLTPIAKAWPSEYGNRANALAIQVLGGYGYARDYPVERYYRDNRINPIHEGTNGIQAIDLLGRKVLMEGGEPLRALLGRMRATVADTRDVADLAECAGALDAAVARVEHVLGSLLPLVKEGALDAYLANASAFLEVLGHTVVAWLWLGQAAAALRARGSPGLNAYYAGKIEACRYFFRWELPVTEPLAHRLATRDVTTLRFAEAGF